MEQGENLSRRVLRGGATADLPSSANGREGPRPSKIGSWRATLGRGRFLPRRIQTSFDGSGTSFDGSGRRRSRALSATAGLSSSAAITTAGFLQLSSCSATLTICHNRVIIGLVRFGLQSGTGQSSSRSILSQNYLAYAYSFWSFAKWQQARVFDLGKLGGTPHIIRVHTYSKNRFCKSPVPC